MVGYLLNRFNMFQLFSWTENAAVVSAYGVENEGSHVLAEFRLH